MAFNNGKLPYPGFFNETYNIDNMCNPFCDPSRNLEKKRCPLDCYRICREQCISTNNFLSPSTNNTASSSTNKISPPPPILRATSTVSLTIIVSLSLLFATFLLFSLYMIHKAYTTCYNSRQRTQRENQTNLDFLDQEHDPNVWHSRTIGLLPSVINTIPLYEYKNGEGKVEGTECSVCLSEFQEDETLRLLPRCNHAFHLPCIDMWLSSHTNCPNCRAGILVGPNSSVENPSPPVLTVADSHPPDEAQLGEILIEDEENGLKRNGFLFHPMRRSLSFDSSSQDNVLDKSPITGMCNLSERNMASVIDQTKTEVNNRISIIESVSDSSIGRSFKNGPIILIFKRSFSWSDKVLVSRHSHNRSRIRSSILPL